MTKFSKILFIITQSELGGAQRYVLDLANHLKDNNYDIIVASGQSGHLLDECKKKSIQIHIFKNLIRPIHPFKDLFAFFEIYSFIKKEKPDIVHLNSSKAGILGAVAAKAAGAKKVVYTVHGFVFMEPMAKWKKIFYICAEKFSSFFKDAIICVSEYDKKMGIRYRIAPEKKFITIHNGIEPINFLPKEEAQKFLLKSYQLSAISYKLIIGTIANFYPTKGLLYLVQSAKKIIEKFPQTLFVIIGDGEDRKILENEIAKLSIKKNVLLLGKVTDALRYLRAFDIYVCSSVKEGLPYSIIEAMSAGLPIVATNVGGIPELLANDCGILVEPKNSDAIFMGIEKIISSPGLGNILGNNAKIIAQKKYSLDTMIQKTHQIYL